MEKRKVRIYKSPDGEGKYINKTKQFLEKAQDGMQVSGGQDDVQEQLENVKLYIKGLKSEDIDDQDIYKVLVSKGIRKDIASYLLEEINSEIEEEEVAAEQKENGATEEGKNQEQEMSQEETSAEEEPDQGMEYYNSYANEEDDYNPNMEYQYGGKTSKRNFTKNVLSLLKKQEGGAEKEPGKGERFDTINGDVSKKSEFVSKIKEIADKAAVDELYKKMMGSNNPELIEGAKKIAEQRNKPSMGTFQEAQSGGLVGGDKQPEMFMYGGTELPFYEADFLPEARYGYSVGNLRKAQNGDNGKLTEEELKQAKELGINDPGFSPSGTRRRIDESRRNKWIDEQMQSRSNSTEKNNKTSNDKRTYIGTPYNARTREAYTDSFEGLNPYAKTVHKRGLFGRPKQWTEYYSKGKGSGKPLTPGQKIKAAYEKQMAENKSLKHGVEKDVWDDLSGKAKRAIRRGERQLDREARRGYESMIDDAKFSKGVHAQYKYNSEEDLARDQKRSEDAWNSKEKEFVSDLDNSVKSPYKDLVYNQDGDVVTMPELLPAGYTDVKFEMPERPLQEDETSYKNMLEATRARDEAIEEKRLYEQMLKEEELGRQESELADLELERESMAPFAKIESDAQSRLKAFYDDTKEDDALSKEKLNKYGQFGKFRDFRPDDSKNMELIKASYDKGYAKEAAMEKELEDAQYKQFDPSIYDQKLGYRYGGLPKAQTGPPVKKPSDPSTNTTDLSGMLKPASNPNTLMGATQSFPGAPSAPVNPDAGKVKTVEMDPNQTKGQTITSLDFGDPKNDDIIAVDKQRAPMNFDGEDAVNKFNVGATAVTGFLNNLDAAEQQKEMYDKNFTSDNMYAATNTRDRGDYVDYGQQLGQFRYDQMGSDTSGRFAYGQMGGYMQDGGFTEGDEVDMTEEELEEFLANGGEVEYL